MKLSKSTNPSVCYIFGDKNCSLSQLLSRELNLESNEKPISYSRLVLGEQSHSDQIKVIEKNDLGSGTDGRHMVVPVVDGFVSNITNSFLVIKSADCVPILVYAKDRRLVGACHSGRQGTKKGIIKKLIRKLIENYKVNIDDLIVLLGPSIKGRNYQVSEDIFYDFICSTKVKQEFRKLDLQKVIIRDLELMGLNKKQIVCSNICTFEDENYNSYRRDKTAERQLSIIGITDEKIF